MRQRLVELRKALHDALVKERKVNPDSKESIEQTAKAPQVPGNWDSVLSSTGLFCFLPLSPQQCEVLGSQHHIYMLSSGRINISGMNRSNIQRIALAIDEVVRGVALSRL